MSVIIPAYRSAAYVQEAVESVLAQTYSHIETIVVPDDGETYQQLRDGVSSSRLRILPPDGVASGPGPARNRGINAATGDIFALCDADDLWPANYLETLVPIAREFGAACATTVYTDWDGTPIRQPPSPPMTISISGYAQLLSSLRPVVLRRLEPGYLSDYAQDVIHDLQVIAELGGQMPISHDTHYTLRERPGSLTNSGQANEHRVHEAYARYAHAARYRPTSLGLQRLGTLDRLAVAEAFDFRGFVSKQFEQSATDASYNQFVSGRESMLWDQFQALLLKPPVSEPRALAVA